ncbi:extracellular solute-binding protein [Paenibacillus koleovorans]|uniref:extracellular solute-binding protein n=1 Tax=Paenibacillus koleovorans TaxID=121608 RepID=UPI000FDC8E3E|nr:extracellular solute-binding protein [Paenibacillus koleovorans]
MKKHFTRVIALSMATALVLSACGGKEGNGTASPSPSSGASVAPSAPTKEKLTLTWMIGVPTPSSSLPSGDKDFIRKAIEEKFNVEIKLDYMPMGQDYTNKLNSLIASGSTPDFFQPEGTATSKYIADGVGMDLTNLVTSAKMPNYFKWVSDLEMKRYQVGGKFMRAPVPFERNWYLAYYVRKDWIDALNAKDPSLKLKVPTNYDEMIAVMKAFTFNDPDGNGKNDTYGYTTVGGGNSVPGDFPEWYKNGMTPGFAVDKDNNFVDSGTNARTAKVLEDIRKMLAMNIVDPDWFLNKAGDQLNKIQQGRAGIFYSSIRDIAFDNTANSVQKKTREVTGNQKAEFVAFHIAGDVPVTYEALPGMPFMFNAKADPKKVDRTIEILEWLAGPEGFLLANFGKEGVHYKKEGNKITLIPDTMKKDIGDNGNFTEIWGSVFSYLVKDPSQALGLQIIDPRETDHDREILATFKKNKYYVLGTNVVPPVGLDIGSYRTQMRAKQVKVLMEEKDSSNWPKYLQELLDTYKGKAIFDAYAEQISTALGKKIVFKTE